MRFNLTVVLLCVFLLSSATSAQELPAWPFIRDSQQKLMTTIQQDAASFTEGTSYDPVTILQATNEPEMMRSAEVQALLGRIPDYAFKLVDEWEDPFSYEGVAHVALCAEFVCPRFNDPQFVCGDLGIEEAAKRLVEKIFEDPVFRRQYRKFLVWSGFLIVREPLGGDFVVDTRSSFQLGFSALKRDIASADEPSWRHLLRCTAYATVIGYDAFFQAPVSPDSKSRPGLHAWHRGPENVEQRFSQLERFLYGNRFSPRSDGSGWRATEERDPSGDSKILLGNPEAAVSNKLYKSVTFDQAVRWLLLANGNAGGLDNLLAKAMESGDDGLGSDGSPKK